MGLLYTRVRGWPETSSGAAPRGVDGVKIVAVVMEIVTEGVESAKRARLWGGPGAVVASGGFHAVQFFEVLISMRNLIFSLCLLAAFDAAPAVAQPKAGPATTLVPVAADACYAGYGLKPAEKIKICSDVIDSGSVKGLGLGLSYFNRGQALANSGDPKAAMADYRLALRQYNDVIRASAPNAQIVFQRGLIYHIMGDADQAIVDYSDAIRLAPNETFAYVNRGIVLYTKKDNNEGAIADFNTALKLNKCEVNAWINRGRVYKRKGDLNQSIADFTSAIACLPGNPAPITSASLDPGKPMSAAYFQTITQTTQLADAYYQRGLVYLDKAGKERGQALPILDKALADFSVAIRINPTAAGHFVGRASTHMYKEEFQP